MNTKPDNLLFKLLLMLIISSCLPINACFSQTIETTRVLEIVIIDFLYVLDRGQNGKQLEKDVLIPNIDRALNLFDKKLDYRFKVKRVTNGHMAYFIRRAAEVALSTLSYDIALWGQVTPRGTLGDYGLQLIVLTNPIKFGRCIYYYEFEIRDGRIRMWNNKQLDLPESTYALIPSILCYKLISFLNNKNDKTISSKDIVEQLERKLLNPAGKLPLSEILGWHPEQECDDYQLLGSMEMKFDDGDVLIFPLHRSLYDSLDRNIAKGISYNWSIHKIRESTDQGMVALDKLFDLRQFFRSLSTEGDQRNDLKEKWSTLLEAKKRSEELGIEISAQEAIYSRAYASYLDAYNLNIKRIAEKDSLENHITSLIWSTEIIQQEIALLVSRNDNIISSIDTLITLTKRIIQENDELLEIRDKLQKESKIFAIVLPNPNASRVLASAKVKPFVYSGDADIMESSYNSYVVTRAKPHFYIKIKAAKEIQDLIEGIGGVDTSLIVKTIKKGENELAALVEIDILLTNRFNQRLDEYSEILQEGIEKIGANEQRLKKDNDALTDSLRQLYQQQEHWSAKFDSNEIRLKDIKDKITESLYQYDILVNRYHAERNEQIALLDEIRELYLKKIKGAIKNR